MQQLHACTTPLLTPESNIVEMQDAVFNPGAACPTTLADAVSSNSGHHFEQQSLQLWSND